jgi:hypothetical protein
MLSLKLKIAAIGSERPFFVREIFYSTHGLCYFLYDEPTMF